MFTGSRRNQGAHHGTGRTSRQRHEKKRPAGPGLSGTGAGLTSKPPGFRRSSSRQTRRAVHRLAVGCRQPALVTSHPSPRTKWINCTGSAKMAHLGLRRSPTGDQVGGAARPGHRACPVRLEWHDGPCSDFADRAQRTRPTEGSGGDCPIRWRVDQAGRPSSPTRSTGPAADEATFSGPHRRRFALLPNAHRLRACAARH